MNPKPRNTYTHWMLEEAGRSLPGATGGKWLCDALTSDFCSPVPERIRFYSFKPLPLWYVSLVALGD